VEFLIAQQHQERLLISNYMSFATETTAFGGFGYQALFKAFVARIESNSIAKILLHDNPKRIFSWKEKELIIE